jgi:hypothetical protein
MSSRGLAGALAGIDLRSPEYTLWWGVGGLLLPAAFVGLLVVLVRMGALGRRSRLPVDSRGVVSVVGHLLRADQSLTENRLNAPSWHGRFELTGEHVRWIYDRRHGWTAPAGVLIVHRVEPGVEGPLSAGVEFEIGGTGEWSGRWRMVLGGVEPRPPAAGLAERARRRRDAALAGQLAAALVAQGAIDARDRASSR